MHFNFPHKTSAAHAVARIKTTVAQHRREIEKQATITKMEWEGHTLDFIVEVQGKKITGKLQVTEKEYIVDATLPLLWRMFEGKIEKEIAKQMQALK